CTTPPCFIKLHFTKKVIFAKQLLIKRTQMEEILKRVILENQEIIAGKTLVSRNYSVAETDNITVLTGIRRCGKTYTLYEIARTMEPERVLFLDFEDERLMALNSLASYDIITDT